MKDFQLSWTYFIAPAVALPFMFISYAFDERILLFTQKFYNVFADKIIHWFVEVESVFFVMIVVSILFLIELHKTQWIVPLLTTAFVSVCASYTVKLLFLRRRPFDAARFPAHTLPSASPAPPSYGGSFHAWVGSFSSSPPRWVLHAYTSNNTISVM